MSRKVLAAVTDLFFVAKVEPLARRAGAEIAFCSTTEELLAQAKAGADLVLLDLNDRALDALELIEKLRAHPETASLPTMAFFSHVQTELGRKAQEAGCHQVIPRSQLAARLVDFLRG
ncbi:MAG: response regulator [Acidobacteriota bacterium]